MASINNLAARRVFWCQRCGTLKTETYTGTPDDWFVEVEAPKLVERCRRFAPSLERLPEHTGVETAWHRLGIAESINLPADLPVTAGEPELEQLRRQPGGD